MYVRTYVSLDLRKQVGETFVSRNLTIVLFAWQTNAIDANKTELTTFAENIEQKKNIRNVQDPV
jgi:tRNA(Phe) wybutosine-synthesizing methylase Tyw3